ncbi:MAG: alpha/beta hydrolase [Oscillospiraceae bacterium]|nr:alpha/beta hydrolase [Oscillospiraceae bacterium]
MLVFWLLGGALVLLLLISFFIFLLACLRIDSLTANLDKTLQRPVYNQCKEEILAGKDWMERHPHEDVTVRSHDGLLLRGEYFPHPNAVATIIMVHGWRGTPITDFGCAIKAYHDKGLNTLLVHQRTQGPSEGTFITFGIRESRDVHSWVQWHAERFGKEAPILLTGISMGATSVLMAGGRPFCANVRGIIADCGFSSPWEIIGSVIRSTGLPPFPFLPVVGIYTRILAGFGLREYSTLEAVRELKIPVFFAHGEADTFVPCSMTVAAYEACGSPDKTLLTVPDAKHGTSYLADRENYEKQIHSFVNRCCPRS